MSSNKTCRKCGATVDPTDTYCGACGEKIVRESAGKRDDDSQRSSTGSSGGTTCKLCGHANTAGASTCAECGASLISAKGTGKSPAKKSDAPGRNTANAPLTFLQSWKLTALMGVLLVATLIYIGMSNKDGSTPASGTSPQAGMPPQHEELVKQIQALQKLVDANPKNADALVQLGNIYYDQRLFPRAIMMYERYLELNASDPNARVDLGVSYFEMALQDSIHRDQYFATAKKEMETAIRYSPKHQLAYYNLGMVNLHTGDIDKATDWFKRCYQIDSTTESGKRAQQLVKNHVTAIPSQ